MNPQNLSTNYLLSEYIKMLREQQHYQANVIMSYNNAFHNINNNISAILLRNYDRYDNRNRRQGGQDSFSQNRESFFEAGQSFFPQNRRNVSNNISNTLPTLNIPRTNSRFRNRNSSIYGNRRASQSPINTSHRGVPRFGGWTRNIPFSNTGNRNFLQEILNRSFNVEQNSQPLYNTSVEEITTPVVWRDISGETTQNMCPFTLEEFQQDTEILRINRCGHLFTREHLERFLTNFDHRCPVCRAELNNSNVDISNNTQSNIFNRNIGRGLFSNGFSQNNQVNYDISYNITDDPSDMNGLVNNITNILSDTINDSLNSAIENTTFDASNNSITFDFSLWSSNSTDPQNNSRATTPR